MTNPSEDTDRMSHARSDPRSLEKREPTSSDLKWLFNSLFDLHGPRNWWPTVHGGKFEMVIGAILTQRTSWRNVETALRAMREADIWSFDAILDASDDELQEAIHASIFRNVKARKLKEFATFMIENFDGDLDRLFELDVDILRQSLIGIWGIGDETADDIILYGAAKPIFVIDAYTKRLLNRLGWEAENDSYAAYQELFHSNLPLNTYLFNEYHALIVFHSARICKSKPLCSQCGLAEQCPIGLGLIDP